MNDILSDMLVRIKNAQSSNKKDVIVIGSKLNRHICDLLVDEGYIQSVEDVNVDNKSFLKVGLKYYSGNPVIQTIQRKSKCGLRVYVKANEIPNVVDGFGILVLSTSKGIKSHLQAKQENVGGELLFMIN